MAAASSDLRDRLPIRPHDKFPSKDIRSSHLGMARHDNEQMSAGSGRSNFVAKLLPYTTVLLIIAMAYVGWVFYSRWRDAKRAEENATAKKAEQNKKVVDQVFGSGQVKLLNFSVSRVLLHPGETTQMCYGVSNAVSVIIEPHVEETKPSFNHCFAIAPKADTTYTLTAKDAAEHTETASLLVTVR